MTEWITTANGIITLITGLVGLIGTGIGAFFAIKNWITVLKTKSSQEIWALIMEIADAAMAEAERAAKKTIAPPKNFGGAIFMVAFPGKPGYYI